VVGDGGAEPRRPLRIDVIGDRRIHSRGPGNQPAFGEPVPFTSMPVRFDRAYGGRDHWAERGRPDELAAWLAHATELPEADLSAYLYLRNPCGRGYVVYPDQAAFDELLLPNLEWPHDRLTPEQLFVGDPGAWPRAPLPAAFDWVEPSWFPRVAWVGARMAHALGPEDFAEVRAGLLTATQVDPNPEGVMPAPLDERFFRGAVSGLALAALTGRETIVVKGMHPTERRVQVPLPPGPKMVMEPPGGKPREIAPALRTVVVRPDKDELETLWIASVSLPRQPTETELAKVRYAVSWKD
jgi:hypothetical protein